MGMRGIIAVEREEKVYLVTTVQWLTVGDQSWKSFTEGMTAVEKAEAAKEFAENIVRYNHISYFECREGEGDPSRGSEGVILVGDNKRRLVTSELVFEEGGAQTYRESVRSHPHHQDGQAMIIRKNGKVTFLKPRF